jgi:NTP pyrophosphatase (non-canonical NTP hydrolase)
VTQEEIFRLARETFDAYAGMDAPDLPADPMSALQVRLARWQNTRFPISKSETEMTAGISEEIGEFAGALGEFIQPLADFVALVAAGGRVNHAALKHEQKIRGMGDREAYRRAAADAVADILIYATNLATGLRLDIGVLFRSTAEFVMRRKGATTHSIEVLADDPDAFVRRLVGGKP